MTFDDFFQPVVYISILIAYLVPKLTPKVDKLFLIVKDALIKKLPQNIRKLVRRGKLKRLKKLKEDRRNIAAINFEIAKANSAYILFMVFLVLYIYSILGPLRPLLDHGIWVSLLAGLPVYIFEAIWLSADAKAKKLVAHAGKVRPRRNQGV